MVGKAKVINIEINVSRVYNLNQMRSIVRSIYILKLMLWIVLVAINGEAFRKNDYQNKSRNELARFNKERYSGEYDGLCGQIPVYPDKQDTPGGFRILHGTISRVGEWPFMARILVCKTLYGKDCATCSGSIINRKWVLTAAHCLHPEQGLEYHFILVGQYDDNMGEGPFNGGTTTVKARKLIRHEKFSGLNNDVGLIKLYQPLRFNNFAQPICLPDHDSMQELEQNEVCYLIGYGLDEGGRYGRMFHYQVQAIDRNICTHNYLPFVEHTTCIKSRRYNTNSCYGDSGGPSVCYNRDKNAWSIFGTTSYGPTGCDASNYTVITNVGHFRDWIKTTIENDID